MMTRALKVVIVGDGDAGKTSLRARYLTNTFQPSYRATIGADFISKTVEVSIPTPRESTRRIRRRSDSGSSRSDGESSCSSHHRTSSSQQKQQQRPAKQDGQDQAANRSIEGRHPVHLAAASTSRKKKTMRVTLSVWDTAGQERFRSLGTAFYRGADAVIVAFDVSKRGAVERTLTWYRDFCSMGDLGIAGEADELRMTPKQIRKAKLRRERFCWVAVGCKGDLFEKIRQSGGDAHDAWNGTKWTEARQWFNGILPRYLPPEEEELNAFDGKDGSDSVHGGPPTAAQPYTIDREIPAPPEDVLSRPSPNNEASTMKAQSNGRNGHSRHPDAGVPPGEAPSPGSKATLRKQPSLLMQMNKRSSIHSNDVPNSLSDSETGRMRYDSTTSQSGNSIYYSLRGESTMLSRSPAARSLSTDTDQTATSSSSSALRPTKTPLHSSNQAKSKHSHHRKQSSLSDLYRPLHENVDGGASDGHSIGQSKSARPKLSTIRSNESSATARVSKYSIREAMESQERTDDGPEEEEVVVSGPSVPSGDPIPFPTDELDEEDEEHQEEMRVRRRQKLSRASAKRQSIVESSSMSSGVNQTREDDEVYAIAEQAKEDRQAQATEANAWLRRDENGFGASNQDEIDRRMTLFSARPSSCSSTIRGADDELQDEESNATPGDTSQLNQSTTAIRQPSDHHVGIEDEDDDVSEAGSDVFEDRIEQGFRLFYTSAKDGTSIDDVFQHIARRVAIQWTYEEWEEEQRREAWGYGPEGEVRTAPPTNEELERERMRRAIKISQGKGTGGCCS